MGCDIETYLERKDNKGRWVDMNLWKYCSFDKEFEVKWFYNDRNYELFSILADVRSRGNNKPISQPRGLPEDVSDLIKGQYEEWKPHIHSTSYFTLKELMEHYNKNPYSIYSGLLEPQQLEDFRKGILPDYWCQGSSVKGCERRSWKVESVLKHFIDKMIERVREDFYIYDFYDEKEVERKLKDHWEDVRVIFWFDN